MMHLPLLLGVVWLQWTIMGTIPLEVDEIVALSDRSRLTAERLAERLSAHRIILIGEAHDNPAHHAVQLRMVQAIHARHPGMALALEMFPHTLQPQLDRWVAGELSEEAFLDAVEWYFTWGFDPELYWPLLRFARAQRMPLVGMNLPREIVSKVRRQGLAALDEATRAGLPLLHPALTDYRIRLEEVYNAHPMMSAGGRFEDFVTAQTLWDAAMAEALSRWSRAHPDRVVVGLAGAGHLLLGHGIPYQLRQRGVSDLVTLIPWSVDEAWIDPRVADYAWGTPEAPESPPSPRLGVVLDEQRAPGEGAWLLSVQERSPAARAGLQAGDRLLALNGQPVTSRHALVRLVHKRASGEVVRVRYEREGRLQEVELTMMAHGGA